MRNRVSVMIFQYHCLSDINVYYTIHSRVTAATSWKWWSLICFCPVHYMSTTCQILEACIKQPYRSYWDLIWLYSNLIRLMLTFQMLKVCIYQMLWCFWYLIWFYGELEILYSYSYCLSQTCQMLKRSAKQMHWSYWHLIWCDVGLI